MKKKKYLPVNTKPKEKKITTEVENELPIEVIEQLELQAEALIYLIHELACCQESYLMDAISMLTKIGKYKFKIKQDIDALVSISSKLRHEVFKRNQHDLDSVELFGEESEELREYIEQFFFKQFNAIQHEKGE